MTFMLPPTVDVPANSPQGRGTRSASYVSRWWWWLFMGLPVGRVWLSTSMAIIRGGDVPAFPGLGIALCSCVPSYRIMPLSTARLKRVLSQPAFKTCSGFAGSQRLSSACSHPSAPLGQLQLQLVNI